MTQRIRKAVFPVAGLGAHRLATRAAPWVRRWSRQLSMVLAARLPALRRWNATRAVGPRAPAVERNQRTDRRGWLGTGVALAALVIVAMLVVVGGASLRAAHRWAVTVWHLDGQPKLAMWLPRDAGGTPSPVRGAAPGATLVLAKGQATAEADVILPDVVLPPGQVQLALDVDWPAEVPVGTTLTVGPAVVAAGVRAASGTLAVAPAREPGGGLRLGARLVGPPGGGTARATVTAVRLTTRAGP